MLKAHSKVPQLTQAVILVVGSPGVGKHKFSQALQQAAATRMSVEVRVASRLPLTPDSARPEVDYVLFAINLEDRNSFTTAKRFLQFLDARYFINRVGFLVSNASCEMSVCIASVYELARVHNATVFTCDIKNAEDSLFIAGRVISIVELSVGLIPGLSVAQALTFPVPSQRWIS